ncbi:MAG: HAD-IA family hydrolase [Hyphomicrobiaceae bacterium]|nr:HAD-IA family hydrolase [Hyphomicrobiaceae bacterium]
MYLVLFDCDGTLVDSQHIIVAAMQRAFEANNIEPLPASAVLSIVGLSLPLAVERLLPEAEPHTVARVTESYRDAFGVLRRDPAHHEPLYPGMLEIIHDLSARPDVLLGVATGKSIRGVNALFERMQLAPHFATIQTADTNPSKPHPAMIQTALVETGTVPERTVMIGDTTFDVEMARLASVGALGVSWGYHPTAALTAAGAHSIADDAETLHASILGHLGLGARPSKSQEKHRES